MKRHEFLQELRISGSPRGKRIDLAFYVYPNGYGNVYNLASGGKWVKRGRDEVAVSFTDIEDALSVVREVLQVAAAKNAEIQEKLRRPK